MVDTGILNKDCTGTVLGDGLARSDKTAHVPQVAEGLIWVWGSGGASEYIRAAAKRPNVTREIDDLPEGSKVTEVFQTYTRDLPYDWQVCVTLRRLSVA